MIVHQESKTPTCQWCGKEMAQQKGRGRRRKYCSATCKQRAYEQRNSISGSPIPQNAVIMRPEKADGLRDSLYALRCAAEDIATASREGADPDEISGLCDELVGMAREIERLR